MKRFIQGLVCGVALVSAVWFTIWGWPRLTTSEAEKITNVVRQTVESRLRGSVFLEVARWRDAPPSGSAPQRPRLILATAVYERDDQVRRIEIPIFVEKNAWSTPHADELERLDSQAEIIVDKRSKE